jgi:hypothetical protein
VPLLLGFASTTVRALVAALAYAVVGVPERDDDEDVAAAGGTATGRPEVPPA